MNLLGVKLEDRPGYLAGLLPELLAQPTRPAAPKADLDARLAEARTCGIAAVETFAAGLEQDGAAVRAALTLPWNSGQAEGQVNRLKLLKRQSYGRAGFDLLCQRVLMAA